MNSSAFDIPTLVGDSQGAWTLDGAGSTAEFHVKHFWGLMTVHGRIETIEGEGTVGPDGVITGAVRLAATSLSTKMKKRDEHLRSADFFDVARHPVVTVSVEQLAPDGDGGLTGEIRLEIAGHTRIIHPQIEVLQAEPGAVTLRADTVVDRGEFGMTWGPLGMTARQARAVVTTRFVRQP